MHQDLADTLENLQVKLTIFININIVNARVLVHQVLLRNEFVVR